MSGLTTSQCKYYDKSNQAPQHIYDSVINAMGTTVISGDGTSMFCVAKPAIRQVGCVKTEDATKQVRSLHITCKSGYSEHSQSPITICKWDAKEHPKCESIKIE